MKHKIVMMMMMMTTTSTYIYIYIHTYTYIYNLKYAGHCSKHFIYVKLFNPQPRCEVYIITIPILLRENLGTER